MVADEKLIYIMGQIYLCKTSKIFCRIRGESMNFYSSFAPSRFESVFAVFSLEMVSAEAEDLCLVESILWG